MPYYVFLFHLLIESCGNEYIDIIGDYRYPVLHVFMTCAAG